ALSHKQNQNLLLLSLRFRTNKTKTCCCRYVALTLSRKRHLLAQDPAAKRLIRRPQEALLYAKAKRQLQSAQS
ncbi:hypothetical protein ABNX05_20850, partial [Lysinibacillus sp. M3]